MRTYKVKLQFESQEVYDFWVEKLRTVRDCYNFTSKIAYEEELARVEAEEAVGNTVYAE